MSVAVIPMANQLGWSPTDRGLVSAAFFWGYSLTQIPAGYISTKIGGSKVLLFGVVVWSLGVKSLQCYILVSKHQLAFSTVGR